MINIIETSYKEGTFFDKNSNKTLQIFHKKFSLIGAQYEAFSKDGDRELISPLLNKSNDKFHLYDSITKERVTDKKITYQNSDSQSRKIDMRVVLFLLWENHEVYRVSTPLKKDVNIFKIVNSFSFSECGLYILQKRTTHPFDLTFIGPVPPVSQEILIDIFTYTKEYSEQFKES